MVMGLHAVVRVAVRIDVCYGRGDLCRHGRAHKRYLQRIRMAAFMTNRNPPGTQELIEGARKPRDRDVLSGLDVDMEGADLKTLQELTGMQVSFDLEK